MTRYESGPDGVRALPEYDPEKEALRAGLKSVTDYLDAFTAAVQANTDALLRTEKTVNDLICELQDLNETVSVEQAGSHKAEPSPGIAVNYMGPGAADKARAYIQDVANRLLEEQKVRQSLSDKGDPLAGWGYDYDDD